MQFTVYSLNKNRIAQFFNEIDSAIVLNFDAGFEKLVSDLEISRGSILNHHYQDFYSFAKRPMNGAFFWIAAVHRT